MPPSESADFQTVTYNGRVKVCFTPELDGEVFERLYAYALAFRPLFPRSDQFNQDRVYLHGLLLDGERKSIEPLCGQNFWEAQNEPSTSS